MTDRRSAGLSEFTWYSRLAAWIGAAMLLVQSVLGREAGPVTVLAVLLLGIGFLCFLIGLAIDSHVPGTQLLIGPIAVEQKAPDEVSGQPGRSARLPLRDGIPDAPVSRADGSDSLNQEKPGTRRAAKAETTPSASGPARRPKFRERAKRADARPADRPAAVPGQVRPSPDPKDPPSPPLEALSVAVATEVLTAASGAVGSECPRCQSPMQAGQLAATCPVCGRTHHALCWMEHQFHCGAPDCAGHGSLEAAATSEA